MSVLTENREDWSLLVRIPPLVETMLLATCQPTGPWGEAGTSTPRDSAPSLARVIPKCSGGFQLELGGN